MEALADFGTVNLLGVRTFTDAIYRVWFNAFDREAAMQFAMLLVSVTLTLLVLERLARGRLELAGVRGDRHRGAPRVLETHIGGELRRGVEPSGRTKRVRSIPSRFAVATTQSTTLSRARSIGARRRSTMLTTTSLTLPGPGA